MTTDKKVRTVTITSRVQGECTLLLEHIRGRPEPEPPNYVPEPAGVEGVLIDRRSQATLPSLSSLLAIAFTLIYLFTCLSHTVGARRLDHFDILTGVFRGQRLDWL